MKYKLKLIFLLLCAIFVLSGCAKDTSNVSSSSKSSENKESSAAIDKSKENNNDLNKPTTETDKSASVVEKSKSRQEVKAVKKKVVVLDPGHANRSNLEKEPIFPGASELKIKDGGGAEGVISKTPEYAVNMSITVKLKDLLENEGYTVIMTKTMPQQSLGNVERAEIGNKNNANLVLRIHADSAETSDISGASMLVPAPIGYAKDISQISKKYGQTILECLTNEVGMNNRGVVERRDMTGFNWSKVPVVLVETGFLSNPKEDKLLNTEEYQQKIAKALLHGVEKALN